MERQVSVFEPHHLTRIHYPLQPSSHNYHLGEYTMYAFRYSEKRYEPLPLIEDEAVANHQSRENESESAVYSVTLADKIRPPHVLKEALHHRDPSMTDFERLYYHMRLVSSCIGETDLLVDCYDVESGRMLVVHRATRLRGEGGLENEEAFAEEYRIPTVELFAQTIRDSYPTLMYDGSWFLQMVGALLGASDHTIRHIRVQLARQDEEYGPEIDWLPRRYPDYEGYEATAIARTIKLPSESLSEDEVCCICRNNTFEDEDEMLLVLRCSEQHVVCRTDWLSWCKHRGPEHASCPLCREPFFDEKAKEFLKYGTVDGAYDPHHLGNRRYNRFDTFERTCADLDKVLAENNTTRLQINSSVVQRAWEIMVTGALLEHHLSTFQSNQPVLCAEFDLLRSEMPSIIATYDGATMPTGLFFEALLQDVLRFFTKIYIRGGMQQYNTDAHLRDLLKKPNAELLGLRPGFIEFVRRTLNRTLQFCEVRACRQASCASQGWHKHGVKDFFIQ